MTVRMMSEADIDAVAALECQVFSGEWTRDVLLHHLSSDNQLSIVADEDGALLGYLLGICVAGEAEVYSFAVNPRYRKQGIGEQILDSFINEAGAQSVESCFLEVRCSNYAAIRLYRKVGFENVGLRKNYYHNPPEDGFIMRLDI